MTLPVQGLDTADRRAQITPIASTLGVALAASTGAALYAGRLIRPLRRLTVAGRGFSQGAQAITVWSPAEAPRRPVGEVLRPPDSCSPQRALVLRETTEEEATQ